MKKPKSDLKAEPVTESGEKLPTPPPELVDPPEQASEEEQQDLDNLRRRYLLRRFWLSAKSFWGRNGGRLAWFLSFALLAIIVVQVGVQYGINIWNRHIFDALEKKDAAVVFHLIAIFIPLGIGSVVLAVIQVYARMTIQRRWRAWLNTAVIDRWLANGRYYQLNLVSGDHKNPSSASPTTCASRPTRRWISPQASPARCCRQRRSSSCCGPSVAR